MAGQLPSHGDSTGAENRFQLPPRIQLYRAVEDKYETDLQTVKTALTGELTESQRHEFLEQLNDKEVVLYYPKAQRIPLAVDGSDSAHVEFIMGDAPTKGEGFFRVSVRLFADGSPFMTNVDLASYNEPMADSYDIFISSECPPFIVVNHMFEYVYGITGKDSSVLTYLDVLRSKGQNPRYLDDTEAQMLIDGLGTLPVDLGLTKIWGDPGPWPGIGE